MYRTFYIDPVAEANKYGIKVFADTNFKCLNSGESGMIKKKMMEYLSM